MAGTRKDLAERMHRSGAQLWTIAIALCASVALSQILLGLAALAAGAALALSHKTRIRAAAGLKEFPPGSLALALYAGWSLVSALLSETPLASLRHTKELLLLGVPALGAYLLCRPRQPVRAGFAVVAAGAVLALWGTVQFLLGQFTPFVRIRGPLSHHLSFAGLLLLAFLACVAWIRSPEPLLRRAALLALAPLGLALMLNQSRSAWSGAAVGLMLLGFTRVRRVALPLLAAAVLAATLHPGFRGKVLSLAQPLEDTSLRARVVMLQTGTRIVAESPLFGTGPGGIETAYARLQPDDYPLPRVGHLHCTPLQIAAERGVPALLIWLTFWAALGRGLWRMRGTERSILRRDMGTAAAACAAGFMVMGIFEYNFGDAEPSTLLLGLLALPFAARATPGEASCASSW